MHGHKDDTIAGVKSMLSEAMTQIGETKEKQDLYLLQELKQFRLLNESVESLQDSIQTLKNKYIPKLDLRVT